jgi:MinD-like ATPase involved in chromosome partitioning or flagellar assembly
MITTFYSYKGGVGRTMIVANIAAKLASWGYSVLCVDGDFEAPGLSYYCTCLQPLWASARFSLRVV